MRSYFAAIATFIADTNLFIALGASGFAGCSYWFFGLPANGFLLLLVFSGTLFMYNFQRMVGDLGPDSRLRRAKTVLMYAGAVGALIAATQIHFIVASVLVVAAVLSVAYAVPPKTIVPALGQKKIGDATLRKTPYFKTWTILLVWLLTGIGAPMFDQAINESWTNEATTALFIVMQGGLVLALTAAFDIRDLPFDDPQQRTLPQILGVAGTIKLSQNALRLSMLAASLLYLSGDTSVFLLTAHLICCLLGLLLVRKSAPHRNPLFFSFWIDGLLVLQAVLFFTLHRI